MKKHIVILRNSITIFDESDENLPQLHGHVLLVDSIPFQSEVYQFKGVSIGDLEISLTEFKGNAKQVEVLRENIKSIQLNVEIE